MNIDKKLKSIAIIILINKMSSEGDFTTNSVARFKEFMNMHTRLLECYSSALPVQYKYMNQMEQKDFCYAERVRLETEILQGKITPRHFFAAAKAQ